uniref:Uncharacterized protein n=1 Tax=Arundo donax TaxID=35708 RepID=A0A0A9FQI9_ARUDO
MPGYFGSLTYLLSDIHRFYLLVVLVQQLLRFHNYTFLFIGMLTLWTVQIVAIN